MKPSPVKLTSAVEARLRARKLAIEGALTAQANHAAKAQAVSDLAAQISKLESSMELDDAEALNLLRMRQKLPLMQSRMETDGDAPDLKPAMVDLALDLGAALSPIIDNHIDRIAAAISPYCTDAADAKQRANDLPFITSCKYQVISWTSCSFTASPREARAVLRAIDALLAGREPFTWDQQAFGASSFLPVGAE